MATFTISLTVGAQVFSYSETVTNTNAQRIGPAYRSIYGLSAETTDQAVWNVLGKGVADGIKANVLAQERADQEADIEIPPLD
jgi:hypothetical protein